MQRQTILETARSWIGTPYHHQQSLKGIGCDCLGLIRGIYRELYGFEPETPPAYTADWAEATGRETLAEAARRHLHEIHLLEAGAGDILLFRWRSWLPAKHTAIISTQNKIIHAYNGQSVSEAPLHASWKKRIGFAFRFPGIHD